MQAKIVLIRGLPGSGKSTLAKEMTDFVHLEADQFFISQGKYNFDASKVREAHNWCVSKAKSELQAGRNVVVSNTFIKIWEMQRYINLGYPYEIIETHGTWKNIHGVPLEKIEAMRKNWEPLSA